MNPTETLRCRRCSSEIGADKVDLTRQQFRCDICAADLGIDALVLLRQFNRVHMWFDDHEDGLQIRSRWFWGASFLYLLVVVFGIGTFFYLYDSAVGQRNHVLMSVQLASLILAAVYFYLTVASFSNQTVINADKHHITVRHTPLPWFGNRRIPRPSVEQVYCRERVHRHKDRITGRSYEVHVLLRSGRRIALLSAHTLEEALSIRGAIAKHLGLLDADADNGGNSGTG